jgi:hypothetical protein
MHCLPLVIDDAESGCFALEASAAVVMGLNCARLDQIESRK